MTAKAAAVPSDALPWTLDRRRATSEACGLEGGMPLGCSFESREKRQCVFEGGHVPPRQLEVVRETLDWQDRDLGPIG